MATISNGVTSYLVYDAFGKLVAEYGASAGNSGTQYVFTDHQGSTRVVTKQSGEVISRQDYQPFGEEIGAVGMRSTDPYYGDGNSARQKYAGMEQDDGSGMSHTLWRKYNSQSGRWTSPDPYGGSMTIADPQSFNRYTYVSNDPVNMTDPLGLMGASAGWGSVSNGFWGRDFNDFGSHFGGLGIISEAMDRYQGPDEKEDSPYKDDEGDNSDLAEGKNASNLRPIDAGSAEESFAHSAAQDQPIEELVSVVIWTRPTTWRWLKRFNPVFRFGHVSYIIGDQMYSWEANINPMTGQEDWFIAPAGQYVNDKLKDGSSGMAYVLDFGSREVNERFKKLLIDAYNSYAPKGMRPPDGKRWGYNITLNNCGHAFARAINRMNLQGVSQLNAIKPSSHEWYIHNVLLPRGFVRAQRRF